MSGRPLEEHCFSEDSEAVAPNQWVAAVVDVIEGDQP